MSGMSHSPALALPPANGIGSVDFSLLERAFGPDSLGILIVSGLPPSFPRLRRRMLSYASRLGSLPEEELERLERPEASYLVGWFVHMCMQFLHKS